jgi:hypothetical protein
VTGSGIDLDFISEKAKLGSHITSLFVSQIQSPTSDKVKAFVEINKSAKTLITDLRDHISPKVTFGEFNGVIDGVALASSIWQGLV